METRRTRQFGVLAITALLFATTAVSEATSAGTLDRVRKDRTIRIAYREDAPPFSFKGVAEPEGYIVDLCRAVTTELAKQMSLPALKIVYVPVTAVNRFETVQQSKADILCEATSATLSRRKVVDFSLPTFVDGASIMIRTDGPKDFKALNGRKIGVLGGTTTEQALRDTLKDVSITAEVITAKTHDEGLKMLVDNKISAYFADRGILQFLFLKGRLQAPLQLAEDYLSIEPYALAIPRGDQEFRLAIDTALSHIYRSGEIIRIFQRTFAGAIRPSPVLDTLYMVTGLPD